MPKKRSSAEPAAAMACDCDPVNLIDKALDYCRALETVSVLLEIAAGSGELQPATTAQAGWMICSHSKNLRGTLESLREKIPKRKRGNQT